MKIYQATTDEALKACYPVMFELRNNLTEAEFIAQAKRQMANDHYQIWVVEDQSEITAVAGLRITEMLWRGKFIYIDDLVTAEKHRKKGYAKALLDHIESLARQAGCTGIDLDSGTQRSDAHRFYFKNNMRITCYHFIKSF